MSTFDTREKAEEARYAAEETLRFKAKALRDRLVGQWAAAKLKLTGAAAEAFVSGIVATEFAPHAEDALGKKLLAEFKARGVKIGPEEIATAITEKMTEAMGQVKAGA